MDFTWITHTLGPQFAQIYIYDTDHEIQNRLNAMDNLDSTILAELQQMLHDINPYVNIFRQVGNLLKQNPLLDLKLVIINNKIKDFCLYNVKKNKKINVLAVTHCFALGLLSLFKLMY